MATTPQTNATLSELASVLHERDDFVICGHVSPDGDCLGSQLALYHALRALGKTAACVLVRDEPVGPALAFLPGLCDMIAAKDYEGPCEVFVGVDVPSRERIGEASALLDKARTSITIDHHASETTMCDYVYVDPDSASASIIVWEVVKLLVDKPPLESAECAFAGLVTDTGGFRHQNCDVRAFRVASELVDFGVNAAAISSRALDTRTFASLQLEKLVIERMSVFCGGEACMSWVTQEDFEKLGAEKADAEALIDTIRSLNGIRVACMLREQDGVVRGSLRAKDGTDVSVLARAFGGGGHKGASGFSLDIPLDQARRLLPERIGELIGVATGL